MVKLRGRPERYREEARKRYAAPSNDNIEIDDDATVARTDQGAFVQAWVWIPIEDVTRE